MPRTLPWKDANTPRAQTPVTPKVKPRRNASPDDLVNSDLDDLHPVPQSKRKRYNGNRTPSTSPPPAAPNVEYMSEGFDKDDSFIMVEDEFHSVAKLFTQHIHFEEYARLKRLAKSRGNDTLAGIKRATDGSTEKSTTLLLREEAEGNAEKRKEVTDSESESNDEYLTDPQLAGLMTTSRMTHKSSGRNLAGIAPNKANTRAAAGYLKSPQKVLKTQDVFKLGFDSGYAAGEASSDDNDEETDDDDLNVAPRSKRSPQSKIHAGEGSSKTTSPIAAKHRTILSKPIKICARHEVGTADATDVGSSIETDMIRTQQHDADGKRSRSSLPGTATPGVKNGAMQHKDFKAADFIAQRKAAREKRERGDERRARLADEIPTFLF